MRRTVFAGLQCLAIVVLGLGASVRAQTLGPSWRDCADCPELVTVPAGRFLMGSDLDGEAGRPEGPVREVRIARAFALGLTEITVEQFARFVAVSGYRVAPGGRIQGAASVPAGKVGWRDEPTAGWQAPGFSQPATKDMPVVCVGRVDALAYVRWLSAQTGHAYRLPSESEWEYAARGGSAGIYSWGSNADLGCGQANLYDRRARALQDFGWGYADCDDGYAELAPVGRLKANGFGLYDMLGNVGEWVADCYRLTYDGAPSDGSAVAGDAGCEKWSVRGGGWMTRPTRNRLTFRGRDPNDARYSYFGFRVARDLDHRDLTDRDRVRPSP
ncbi:MAG: formylglycine-generating enzyme family protein [Nevskiaceae bacterium]